MTLFGSSGAGKTYFLVAMIERYLKSVSTGASIRPIIWLSPEEQIDKTLEPLKKPRWSHYYHGIDISEKAVKESKLSAEEYFGQHVRSVIERHGENSLIAFDDFLDAAPGMYPLLERLYNSSLRVARHMNSGYSVCSTRTPGTAPPARACSRTVTSCSSPGVSSSAASASLGPGAPGSQGDCQALRQPGPVEDCPCTRPFVCSIVNTFS